MRRLPLQYHPDARTEALTAFDWYYERSPAAAGAFMETLDAATDAIQENPEAWSPYLFGTRYYLLKRFPFLIVYRVTETRIEIIAVAHGHRRPGYWADRL